MKQKRRKHNIVEKITFALGLLTLIASITYLIVDSFANDNLPPQLLVATNFDASAAQNGYRITVYNASKQTAASAEITFALYQQGKESQTAAANFNFIGAKSEKTAFIVFDQPHQATDSLVMKTVSFLLP